MLGLAQQLLRPFVGGFYKSTEVRAWPKWAADLMLINVPSNITPKASASPDGGANINILLNLIDQSAHVPGNIAECGVFRGESFVSMALYLEQKNSDKKLYAFDSFEGFDDLVDAEIELGGTHDTEKRKGGFSNTSENLVLSRLKYLSVLDRVSVHKGYFEKTLDAAKDERFSFVHLDCDIYDSYKQCLEFFYGRMEKDAVLLFDEYEDPPWPGCKKAVDEFLSDKPETLVKIERDNYQKYYFTKI